MKDNLLLLRQADGKRDELIAKLVSAIVAGDVLEASRLTKVVLSLVLHLGLHSPTMINHILEQAMNIVGSKYIKNEIFVPELLLAIQAEKATLSAFKEYFDIRADKGKVMVMTVKDDIHELGKTIFATLLEGNGFEVLDLGVDVPLERLAENMIRFEPDIVGLSTSLTTTKDNLQEAVQCIKKHDQECVVIMGGVALTTDIAIDLGADFYAINAVQGVEQCNIITGY